MKPRFANVGNPALRNLYLGDTEPYVPPAEEVVIPLNERKYIQTLTESLLPLADRRSAAAPISTSAARTRFPGLPYCEVHARRAFQPPQARRRDRDMAPMVVAGRGRRRRHADAPDAPAAPGEKAVV